MFANLQKFIQNAVIKTHKSLQRPYEFFLHIVVNSAVASKGTAAFCVAAKRAYKIGVFHLFV